MGERTRYIDWRSAPAAVARGVGRFFAARARLELIAGLAAIGLLWSHAAFAAEPRVILLRGWFGVFSTGLDGLAEALKTRGIKAEVAGHLYWETAVSEILRDRAAGKIVPIVLIGHSQGANNVIDMARALRDRKVPVDLLVTLAPYLQYPIPTNVVRAINFYQSPGWGAPLTTEPGFQGKLSNVDMSSDWSVTHINIDKSPRVQAEIAREILALRGREGAASQGAASQGAAGQGAADAALSRKSADEASPSR